MEELIGKTVWFKDGLLTQCLGQVKRFLYDTWFEIYDYEHNCFHFVLPEEITKILNNEPIP